MAEATEGAIDSFLLTAIKIPKDKIFILKLDKELEVFLNDKSRSKLCFPQMNSYQRRVVHRVADYFNLSHSLDSDKKAIVLRKNEKSEIPAIRMSDFVEIEEDQPKVSLKIMQRSASNETSSRTTKPSKNGSNSDQSKLSLEEREAKYQQARARIFNENSSTSSVESKISQPVKLPGPSKIDQTKNKPVEIKSVPKVPEKQVSPTPSPSRRGDKIPLAPKTSLAYTPNSYQPQATDPASYMPYNVDLPYSVPVANDPMFVNEQAHYGFNPGQPSFESPYMNNGFYEPYSRQYYPSQPSTYYPGQFSSYPNYEYGPDSNDFRFNKPINSNIMPVNNPLPGPPSFGSKPHNADLGNGYPSSIHYSINTPKYTIPQQGPTHPFEDSRYQYAQDSNSGYSGYPQYPPSYIHHYPHPYQNPLQAQPTFHYQSADFMRRPPAKNRELFDPNKPNSANAARRSNSGSSNSSRQSDNALIDQFNRTLTLSNSKSSPGVRTKKPDNLLYDYSGDSYEGVRPTDKPVQPNHILEVYDFDASESFEGLTSAGATIRRLKNGPGGPSALAVFKNSGIASRQLSKFSSVDSSNFKLRVWTPTLYDPSKSTILPIKNSSVPVSPVPESIAPSVS